MTNEEIAKIKVTHLAAARQKSLEFLFEYTKFHIGLYLTLTAAFIRAAEGKAFHFELRRTWFWIAVIAFMTAGLAGGVIASSLTQTSALDSKAFLRERIGPWEWKPLHFEARKWTWLEHTSFWCGLVCAVLSFLFAGP